MTDKWSVKWLYIAVRKQSFLTHVQARYENKTLRRLMKASFQHDFLLIRSALTHENTKIPVPMRLWDTPVPIPNTTVKT